MVEEKHIKKNVLSLCLATFFNYLGSGMVSPLYPIFIIQVLNITQMKILGLIETLSLILSLVVRPITGRLADRKGRKKFILYGFGFNFIARLLQAFVTSWVHLIPVKTFSQMGFSMQNPSTSALLSDSVDQENSGKAFGWLEASRRVGAMTGPLIGWGVLWLFLTVFPQEQSYRIVFLIASIPVIIGMAVVNFWSRDFPSSKAEGKLRRYGRFPLSRMGKKIVLFTVICGFFEFFAATESFIIVRAVMLEEGGFLQASIAIVVYWLINLTIAPFALLSGWLSDRIGRKIPIVISMALLSIFSIAFTFSSTVLHVVALCFIFGLYQGFLKPSRNAMVVDLAPDDRKAETLGIFSMYIGMFTLPGPFVFGFLWDAFGWRIPFLFTGIFEFVCSLLILILI